MQKIVTDSAGKLAAPAQFVATLRVGKVVDPELPGGVPDVVAGASGR
jgi:hypothetical protein